MRRRQRRRGGVGESRVGADGHRHLHAALRGPVVLGRVLVDVPVHAGGLLVEHLQPVHAHVARARPRMPGEHQRQGDVAAAVQRPALEDRQRLQVDLVAGEHHFLAGAALDHSGLQGGQVLEPPEGLELVPGAVGHLEGGELRHPGASSSYDAARRARHMRSWLPNWFISTGIE